MPWLEYKLCHPGGYDRPQYIELSSKKRNIVDAAKRRVIDEESDGIRRPMFRVIPRLPPAELLNKIAHVKGDISALEELLWRLQQENNYRKYIKNKAKVSTITP